jgi:hypothetical protein
LPKKRANEPAKCSKEYKQGFAGHQVLVEVGWFLESKRKKKTVFERERRVIDQTGFGCRR